MQDLSRTGWQSSVVDFLSKDQNDLINELAMKYDANTEQINSWIATIAVFKNAFNSVVANYSLIEKFWILFEYELPREGGRRPDIILLTSQQVYVVEIKNKEHFSRADIEQTKAYIRDIIEYHFESRSFTVQGALLVLKGTEPLQLHSSLPIINPEGLIQVLHQLKGNSLNSDTVDKWINSAYEPLPSLIQAAHYIFNHEPLPQIRRAASAGIPQTLASLSQIVSQAKITKDKHLVLLTGSPGSGKTLVGLQFVYIFSNDHELGVFLSGNGPLVAVLQNALKSRVFVQDVHRFIREHGIRENQLQKERILVFDEAQRAWDKEKVHDWNQQHNFDVNESEPQMFIRIASMITGWSMIIALVGNGQEIHNGEESGLGQWADAVYESRENWTIHIHPKLRALLERQDIKIIENSALDLNFSLRSHVADTIQLFVDLLLEGKITEANTEAQVLKSKQFSLFITADLEVGKKYLVDRYIAELGKTYGIVASSKSRNLVDYGLDTGYTSRQTMKIGQIGKWYNQPYDTNGCCSFNKIATEFQCQGLELDSVLLAWGSDMQWENTKWKTPRVTSRNKAKDPHQLRINSYRVLLTRARDGIVVFCPRDTTMEETYHILKQAGFEEL